MSYDTVFARFLAVTALTLWAVIIFAPLAALFIPAIFASTGFVPGSPYGETTDQVFAALSRSFGLAGIIAGVAVVLGWIPGRLFGTCRTYKDLLLLLLLAPLVLPRYVLYYAWTLLLSPTTRVGSYLSSEPELARFVGTLSSCSVLISWYWPLAALLIAQGWQSIEEAIWDSASLDADAFGVLKKITLPLLARPLLLAFGVCFVLCLSEFATFHLAGVNTVGTELAVLYQLTGSESHVARAAWPVAGAAVALAIVLGRSSHPWVVSAPAVSTVKCGPQAWRWVVLLVLVGISLIAPVVILVTNLTSTQALQQFLILHQDELGWSLAIAVVAAAMAHLIAFGVLSLERVGRVHLFEPRFSRFEARQRPTRLEGGRISRACQLLSLLMRTSIFVVMFVPASLVAVSVVRMLAVSNAPIALRESWFIVSAGQASRFAGVALILLLLTRYAHERHLSEMASLDGASSLAAWWHVHLPHTWPVFVGSFILVVMLSMTELSATMTLLPPGLPNFAQTLLNQMHYARDQQVIASCLVLVCLFLILAGIVVLLLRIIRMRRPACLGGVILAGSVLCLTGCDSKSYPADGPKVVTAFGRTGRGPGEFMYPRAIDIVGDDTLLVVDKTGRIQRLSLKGEFLDVIQMPQIEAGKPTGLSAAANGNLYVADTHYHRVVIFSPDGEMLDEFGRFGQENGCFIYPTDIAFSPDGRIFVSEYGGNDRISVFSNQGDFLYCFGSAGDGQGQLSRPAAVCVDSSRKRLYVADACNHRVAIYDFEGKLLGYMGSAGRGPGQLRYPYDLALLPEGTLVVCEYGNNRVQLFDPDGNSLAVYGNAGRQLAQLAYPWGVAVDSRRRAFVVDAGNNRIQVWQL